MIMNFLRGISLLLFITLVLKENKSTSAESTSNGHSSGQGKQPNDPYTSYLLCPRLTFNGTFMADVSTINNNPSNYDTANVIQPILSWNPQGTGEWKVNAVVTRVCYANTTCVVDSKGALEPMVGANFQDGGNKALAKLVDLDTQAQTFSEIWGWRLRIGNFFSADFKPVAFQYLWAKLVEAESLSPVAAAYQSVLYNIKWLDDTSSSPLIEEWRTAMKNENINDTALSIRFNVDLYEKDSRKNSFTYGRITGSIGLLGTKSPPFFTHGRMLHSRSSKVQSAPFIVDKHKQKVYIDFGNSFQTTGTGSFDTGELANLYVGIVEADVPGSSKITCNTNISWLAKVEQTAANWYAGTAGILSLPVMEKLSDHEMTIIKNNPLVVAEVAGSCPDTECKEIVLAEAVDGVDVHPYDDWTMRREPKKDARVRLLVTKFGKPLHNMKVNFETNVCPNVFGESPQVGVPPMAPPASVSTNSDGIAEFVITTIDPKNKRKYIDGQIYPYVYFAEGQKKNFSLMCCENSLALLNQMIVMLVWDKYGPFQEPTWLEHVYPILKQYATIYPVMTENFVDLGNYYEVKQYKRAIILSMCLPTSHPNHMPVTRDLSPDKRKVILDWLRSEDLPFGDPKVMYTIDHLRKDLQTALRLEQATIPPYLTALATIKYNYNPEVQSMLKDIIIEEMTHMCLVANILNAVGGSPVLWEETFIPRYPTRLPGGVQPDLVVPIEKASIGLIRNVFMQIEQPAVTQERKKNFTRTFAFTRNRRKKCSGGSKYLDQENCKVFDKDEDPYSCLDPNFKDDSIQNFNQRELGSFQRRKSAKPMNSPPKGKIDFPESHFEYKKHHNTIGDFYQHILNTLGYLTKCGEDNSIFTGNPQRQVNWIVHDRSYKVTDYHSAVEAIELIVTEGEGSSPCNPMAWNSTEGKELSHYFRFYSIVKQRKIRVFNDKPQENTKNVPNDDVVDYGELCNGTYSFTGPKINFDPEGVWPMMPNPKRFKYKKGSHAYRNSDIFNKIYTKLLKSLQHVFNGYPDSFEDALGLMFSLKLHLKKLIRTPIDPDGDPDIGPNAGPTFEFTP